jgi:hypothetical protein
MAGGGGAAAAWVAGMDGLENHAAALAAGRNPSITRLIKGEEAAESGVGWGRRAINSHHIAAARCPDVPAGLPLGWSTTSAARARTAAPGARFATNGPHRRTTATDQNHSFQLLYVLPLFAQHLRAPSVAFNSPSTVLATVLRCSSSGEPSCYRCSCLLPHIDVLLFAGMVTVVLLLKIHVTMPN